MAPVFHEMVPAQVLTDLVDLLQPINMTITGVFTTRGGIDTTVSAFYNREVRPSE